MNPMVGSLPGCCARAASGHAAAPPSRVMNWRRNRAVRQRRARDAADCTAAQAVAAGLLANGIGNTVTASGPRPRIATAIDSWSRMVPSQSGLRRKEKLSKKYYGNPAENVKNVRRQKDAPEANRPWADEEREAVLEAAPAHILSAIALMMFTGLGPKDALRLPRTFYKAGEIATPHRDFAILPESS